MKNFIPFSILGILILCGLFFAFTDSSESEFLSQIKESKKVIATQTECIDDIEASLYDFSFEIAHLRAQNEFLNIENDNLREELRSQTLRAANLRKEMVNLEVENYNVKRQLEQVLIGREIRARHQENNAELIIADNTTTPTLEEAQEEVQILEMQSQINSIQTEIEEREVALEEIAQETEETVATIQANEAKIEFNIEIDPASDPAIEFNDPLVSQEVLFNHPTDAPKFFTELEMDKDTNEDEKSTLAFNDEFSSKSPIYSLIENTNVMYNYIACRNDRYGKKIKKLKKDSKNWKYTFLQFNLEAENINLLLNKEFRMRVLATDLNTYVNFHTDKKNKTMSHYDFIYEGEPIKISIFNKEVKGKSFDIQIFHLVDGEEYLLEDDQKSLFLEGINMQSSLASKLP